MPPKRAEVQVLPAEVVAPRHVDIGQYAAQLDILIHILDRLRSYISVLVDVNGIVLVVAQIAAGVEVAQRTALLQ